jgi:hypothetical protein
VRLLLFVFVVAAATSFAVSVLLLRLVRSSFLLPFFIRVFLFFYVESCSKILDEKKRQKDKKRQLT